MDPHRRSPLIPQELVDITIDHLHDNIKALSTCSRVARSWLHSSRHHLFRDLTITLSGDDRTVDSFTRLLNSSTNVGVYIRRLRLQRSNGVPFELFLFGSTRPQLDTGVLELILSKLPNLCSLTFCDLDITSHTFHNPRSWTLSGPRLECLAFNNVGFEVTHPEGKRLLDTLGYFPQVDHLVLNSTSTAYLMPISIASLHTPQTESPNPSHHLAVRSLDLSLSIISGDHLNAIFKTVSFQNLSSLRVSCSSAPQLSFVGDMVRSAGNLKHFDFDFTPFGFLGDPPGPEDWMRLRLEFRDSLESLTIRYPLDCDAINENAFGWISLLTFLTTIPSSLMTITFKFTFLGQSAIAGLHNVDWGVLQQFLSAHPTLRSVVIDTHNQLLSSFGPLPFSAQRKAFILQSLPVLNARGLLHVD